VGGVLVARNNGLTLYKLRHVTLSSLSAPYTVESYDAVISGRMMMWRIWKPVAKIIEFYVPKTFRKRAKWLPADQRGKLIQFRVPIKKSA